MPPEKKIHIRYFALLREERGISDEIISTDANTPKQLYTNLAEQYGFSLLPDALRVAINDTFKSWDAVLNENDTVVFIPPVAGG